ncbi:MAG: DUF58 domain-containing protein [Candidatus Acidiferrales bacterium]
MAAASASSVVTRWWQTRDRPGWKHFAIAMVTLSGAMLLALYSAAIAEQGRVVGAGLAAAASLALAGWVAVAIVPRLARRTSLRWVIYQVDYKLTREGTVYLGAVFILVLAAVNTGNNLLFLVLACLLAGLLISGIFSRIVLTAIELKLELPEHIFARQPIVATLDLRNDKDLLPSFSLRVVGEGTKTEPAQILARPVFFPYLPRQTSVQQKVELLFPKRGLYRQDAFAVRSKFPFGLFEKTRRVESPLEVVVYPQVQPAQQFFEVLPLLSGEMESYFRGRGNDLYALRGYETSDSVRHVDWKSTAKTGAMKVREYAREDERRLSLVFDPYIGPAQDDSAAVAARAERFERAVSLAASIAWHFYGISAVMQFHTDRHSTEMLPSREIIYAVLRELATIEPSNSATSKAFLDDMAADNSVFKIILTHRAQNTIPSALWSSSYFIFIDSL